MGKKSEVDVAKRLAAVLSLVRREEPATVIARRYGVAEATLYRWRDVFLQGGKDALTNGGGPGKAAERRLQELAQDMAERDRVIGELTIANRILKKTADHLC